mgnify:CR=1 FL=1
MAKHLPVVQEMRSSIREADGARLTVHPADVHGRFRSVQRGVFAVLIAIYAVTPWINVGGHPAVLLDIAHRRFHLFGAVFNAQDVWMAFFLLSGIGFSLVALTTIAGRVWCGWACPQSVFMEGVFRPLQRLIEGPREKRTRREQGDWTFDRLWRRVALWAAYFVLAATIAHVFLGYFVPIRSFWAMISAGPGASPEAFRLASGSEAFIEERGVRILKTCTPYLAGNVPQRGDHCAWMESSAVVYCNSVIGACTNTEGRESTSAAMLTGKIPDWGFHRPENRQGTHLIEVEVPVESVMDWGMLGYYAGQVVGERIPVLDGRLGRPDLVRHKHFGAAAASSGGVEMYHVVGVTPEAPTRAAAFGPRQPQATLRYGVEEMRRVHADLNSKARNADVDFVMLGCPHYSLDQLREVAAQLAGRRVSGNCRLWIFTSRAVKHEAEKLGIAAQVRAAGGLLLTDTCSSISQAIPPGTKVAALDSAKQVHYLPAFMGVEAWFGSTAECIDAAVHGRWQGRCP